MFLNIRKDVLCEMPPNRTEDDAVCILNWASIAHINSYIKKKNSYADIQKKSIFNDQGLFYFILYSVNNR